MTFIDRWRTTIVTASAGIVAVIAVALATGGV